MADDRRLKRMPTSPRDAAGDLDSDVRALDLVLGLLNVRSTRSLYHQGSDHPPAC